MGARVLAESLQHLSVFFCFCSTLMDLARLLDEVPDIFNHFPLDTKRALLATNSRLRTQVRGLVSKISHVQQGQLSLLKSTDWPSLQKLSHFREVAATEMLQLSYGTWQHLSYVSFTASSLDYASLLLMARASWPSLKTLWLCDTNLHSRGMAALGLGKWPLLKELHISTCNLDDSCIQHLTAAPWTQLELLNIAHNHLTAAAVGCLSKASWPNLKTLDLQNVFSNNVKEIDGKVHVVTQANTELDAGFMQHLSTAGWPKLAMLGLVECRLNAVNMAWLIRAQWPLLTVLDLAYQTLCTASFALLSQSQWPSLKRLGLCGTNVNSAALAHLLLADWPVLMCLDLGENEEGVDAAAIALLVMKAWPCLTTLSLHGNELGADSVAELVKGSLPALRVLDVCGPSLDIVAASKLQLGRWPLLECLALPESEFSQGIIHLLSVGNQAGLKMGLSYIDNPAEVARGVWPKLKSIHFGDPLDASAWATAWGEDCALR